MKFHIIAICSPKQSIYRSSHAVSFSLVAKHDCLQARYDIMDKNKKNDEK